MKRSALRLGLALGAGLISAELALHLFPALLPRAYLGSFPGHGTEFFHPDVFVRTPVEGVLLPHLTTSHRGPPPADLIELGIAPGDAREDQRAFPDAELPSDPLGFPNDGANSRCDLLLVGDSFGVAAGFTRPEGLQPALARATGLAVHNLSLAGLGPAQERWLLESLGLPRRPRAAVWLWYSGNDITASYEPFVARRDGKSTWAEAWPERRRPRLYLPDLISKRLRSRPPPPSREPLPGFAFGERSVWFEPETLRQLGWSRGDWEAHPVFAPVLAELTAARDACAKAGVKLLFVYVPSKPEVLLPYVARDAALAARTLQAYGGPGPAGDLEAAYDALLANRHAQEELLRDFCARGAVPFLSATPALDAQAARGELGYLAADTHWSTVGQAALLDPLLALLREQGVIE